ncbi:MAG: PhzF family phenazine biosynthesis protein [Pseudomonadota bacterium]
MSNTLAFYTLDVFTDTAFEGNPLAVVMDADGLSTPQMQRMASEFNLSETVFVCRARTMGADATARIFTPAYEMPFAGHPTVGTACLMAELGLVKGDTLVLDEQVGPVIVTLRSEAARPLFAQLTAAQAPEQRAWSGEPAVLAAVLGLSADDLGYGNERPREASCGAAFLLVPLRQPELLAGIVFDTARANALLKGGWSHGLYLYARGYDGSLRARMFAPGAGVPEDPATGSAAAALAGVLALDAAAAGEQGELAWTILQGVEMGRPSVLMAAATVSAGGVTAVRVGGHAVRVSEGRIRIPQ